MTMLGIGIDILHLPRLTKLFSRSINAKKNFARRILSVREFDEWITRERDGGRAEKELEREGERWLAVRWTTKEATYKALYPIYIPTWKEITILKPSTSPKPILEFNPQKSIPFGRKDLKFHLSVSHDGDYVISNVIVEI